MTRSTFFSEYIANFKTVLAVGTSVLLIGVSASFYRYQPNMLIAFVLGAYNVFCGFLSNSRYVLACYLVVIPNLLLFLYVLISISSVNLENPGYVAWLISTGFISLMTIVLLIGDDHVKATTFRIGYPNDDA